MKLKICRDNLVENILDGKGPNISCTPLPDTFLWSEDTKVKYQEAFHTSEVKDRISNLENELESNSVEVQSLVNKLTDVMILAADKSLRKRSFKPRKKFKNNRKWYDRDCKCLLREVKHAKNVFNRNVFNNALRINYYSKFRNKKLVKYKKRKYNDYLTNMLSNAMDNDPQTAWKIVNELKNDSLPADKAEKINRSQWYMHFRDLLRDNAHKIDSDIQKDIKDELTNYEKSHQEGSLDYEITEKEVIDASHKLKNNKASAYDMIKNEMIKSAVPFMKQTIVKVFNKLLKLGHFPISWTEGIIVPIHKQGNCSDPNNYRGITLNSCLGKLFCHIFNSRVSNHVENTYFLAKEQAGFRKNFRTSDQSFILKT